MDKKQFAKEFVENLEHQGYGLKPEYKKVFQEIWTDYFYLICSIDVILIHQKILDITRKRGMGRFLK